MIVDCHTHIDCAGKNIDVSEHLEASETVDVCIVLASAADSGDEANKKVSEYVGKYKGRMIGFGFVEPTKGNIGIKNLTSIKDSLGLKGVVLYCSDCGFHPAHSRAMRFYESAQELSLPVFFHNNQSLEAQAVLDYAQPYLLDEIARTFPDLKIIIGTMGTPFIDQTLIMVDKHENVYADLTIRPEKVWQVYNMVVAAHERAVMDKLLFGSGFPSGNAGECIETLLGFNKLLGDTNLPIVPRDNIRSIIEKDTLAVLGIASNV